MVAEQDLHGRGQAEVAGAGEQMEMIGQQHAERIIVLTEGNPRR